MRRAAVLASAVVAAACAGRTAAPPVGDAAAARGSPAPAPGPQRGAGAPPGRYGVEPDPTPTPLEASALEVVRLRLGAGRSPRVSGALVAAAREIARAVAAGDPHALSRARIRAALAGAHAWDPAPTAVLVESDAASVRSALAGALPRGRATHVGAGAAQRGDRAVVVVLSSERKASLAPFPREVGPGERAVLSGRLAAGLARPRVFVGVPSGRVEEVGAGRGPGFRASIAFPSAGRYAVEVVAEGPGGPEVAALLAVSAGGAPLDAPAAGPEEDPPDEADAQAAVVRALNATRRRQGLPALAPSAALAAIAGRHSAAMAAAGTVAHVLPGSGDAGARLRAAGVPYHRVLENVALSSSAIGAHRTTEESPAHLANLLQPGTTQVGVGVARRRHPSGDAVYLTEIFVEPPDDGAGSPLTADARARAALWAERARRGLAPLTADAALDALAREAAAEMRARDDPGAPELADRALALRRDLAAVDVFVGSAPADAVRSANVGDPRFRRMGVGVVTGDSRRFGAGRFWIAVVYTD
jgi:uncharacterized protein YkwD